MLAAPIVAQTLARTTPYEAPAEKAVTGIITSVMGLQTPDGSSGVHMDLKTADGLVSIHVAPAAFIGEENFWFSAGDQVSVIGARMTVNGNVAIWAKAIQKGSALLVLRNADGTPKWTPAIDGPDGCGVNHAALPRMTER